MLSATCCAWHYDIVALLTESTGTSAFCLATYGVRLQANITGVQRAWHVDMLCCVHNSLSAIP